MVNELTKDELEELANLLGCTEEWVERNFKIIPIEIRCKEVFKSAVDLAGGLRHTVLEQYLILWSYTQKREKTVRETRLITHNEEEPEETKMIEYKESGVSDGSQKEN